MIITVQNFRDHGNGNGIEYVPSEGVTTSSSDRTCRYEGGEIIQMPGIDDAIFESENDKNFEAGIPLLFLVRVLSYFLSSYNKNPFLFVLTLRLTTKKLLVVLLLLLKANAKHLLRLMVPISFFFFFVSSFQFFLLFLCLCHFIDY